MTKDEKRWRFTGKTAGGKHTISTDFEDLSQNVETAGRWGRAGHLQECREKMHQGGTKMGIWPLFFSNRRNRMGKLRKNIDIFAQLW
ncbi:MAG: hypothetical protein GX189_01565 [Clostridiales bacterium]|nr:hypothetical protein [Clostridiales bacterium]